MSENDSKLKEKNEIIFTIEEAVPPEIIRIQADGKIFVHGKEVIKDIEVYNGFVEFLKGAGCYHDNS